MTTKKKLILLSIVGVLTSCQRWHDYWYSTPVYLNELTNGIFFLEREGSWSYVKLNLDTTFYQVVYDREIDSLIKIEGTFRPPPYAIEFSPFYVVKHEDRGYNKTEKRDNRFYSLFRGIFWKYVLAVGEDESRYYKYLERRPFKIWYK
jgi:hypothetical protein